MTPRRSPKASHEERLAIINRMKKIRGYPPSVALVMSMWILSEQEALQLLDEADKVEV